jgi:hypothetical protein
MQLHAARLCIDCQEIHEDQMCPVCSSETFAYISRWVPAPERRVKPRASPSNDDVEVYRQLLSGEPAQPTAMRWLRRGAFGVAALGAAAYAWKRTGNNEPGKTEPAKTDRTKNPQD